MAPTGQESPPTVLPLVCASGECYGLQWREQVIALEAEVARLRKGLAGLCLCKGHKKRCGACLILEGVSHGR